MRVKPTFLFIGPDKSGSTWLYEVLRQHPHCFVPSVKDIYFFDRHYHRGLDWYLSFFDEAPPRARAVGELSHDYLYSPEAARRIARDLPDVRLLTCLRDPVDRAFSHYLFLIRSGQTRASFEEALDRYPGIVEHSRYHRYLREYYGLFGRERIKVLWFHELQSNPRRFAAEAFHFLGVEFVEEIQYEERHLGASRPRAHALARLARLGATGARRAGLERLVGAAKRSVLPRLLYRPYAEGDRPVLGVANRARLRETLREDVESLQELLGADLSAWLGGAGRGPS